VEREGVRMTRMHAAAVEDFDPDSLRRAMVSDEEAVGLHLAVGSMDSVALGRAFAQGRLSGVYRDHARVVEILEDERDSAVSRASVWRFLCLFSFVLYFSLLSALL
jgi:uncharacterized membrane protein